MIIVALGGEKYEYELCLAPSKRRPRESWGVGGASIDADEIQ